MTSTRPALALTLLLACGPSGRADGGTETAATATTPTSASAGTTMQAPTTGGTTEAPVTTGLAETTGVDETTGTTALPGTTTGATTTTTTTGVDASTTGDPKLDLPPVDPIPVSEIPGLLSITFYENTSGIMEYTFAIDGPELNQALADPLTMQNRDIQGTSVEFYDVYYSDVDGVFDAKGSYLTIAGSFGAKLPAGGGLNLSEISLNYDGNVTEFGSFLASFVGLGDNYAAGSEVNAIDNDLNTHTTMGNTVDTPDQRLRLTLGFKSSLMPG